MTRQVFSRDIRFDAIKSAITAVAVGGDYPEGRAWAVRRWGEAGAPTEVTKDVSHAIIAEGLDQASTTGLIDRELFKAVREKALLFRLRGIRRTGFRVRSISVSNSRAVWLGEGQAIPVLQPEITNTGLEARKVASLSVWTKEALESAPGVEELVHADLVRATADAFDLALLDPTNDGSGYAPASLTYGATAIAASADFAADLATLFEAFTGNLATAVFLTTPRIGAGLSGEPSGRDVGARGGEIAGVPVLTSAAAPAGQLTLVDPGAVMAAFDELIELQTSEAGTVEMLDSDLEQDPPTGAQTVGLWQNNLVAIRSIARVAWETAGPASPVSLTGLFPQAGS